MGQRDEQKYNETITNILVDLTSQVPKSQHKDLVTFMHHYYSMDTQDDFVNTKRSDLLSSTLAFWNFAQYHDPKKPLIEVFNPDYAHYGWQSNHTIIHLIHRDMPFLIDSMRMLLNEKSIRIHHLRNNVVHINRNEKFNMAFGAAKKNSTLHKEAIAYIEVDRQETSKELDSLKADLYSILIDVSRVTKGYRPICKEINQLKKKICQKTSKDICQFIDWLLKDNFTFLGYEELKLDKNSNSKSTKIPKSAFGLLKKDSEGAISELNLEPCIKYNLPETKDALSFSKAGIRSTVHRPAYPDFIRIRLFDHSTGQLTGEARVLGLYTSPVYRQSAFNIPYVSNKTNNILKRSNLEHASHHAKELVQILEVYPRDELFQTSENELFNTVMSILRNQERKRINLFIRQDPFGDFCSALVFIPREVYNTRLRKKIQQILCQRLEAIDSEFTTFFSESVLARVHFNFKLKACIKYDFNSIKNELILAASTWEDEVSDAIHDSFGEVRGNKLISLYSNAFSAAYKEAFSPDSAVNDIHHFRKINKDNPLSLAFYKDLTDPIDHIHFKLYHFATALPLAEQIPVIKNLGLRVLGDSPFVIRKQNSETVWIHDFLLGFHNINNFDIVKVESIFKEAFHKVWSGETENDEFNLLVLSARLNWRQVAILRTYARYLKQIRAGFSQSYIAETLCNNIEITHQLIELFDVRFNPELSLSKIQRLAKQQQIQQSILEALEQVKVLTEDKIIRLYQALICATLRTNFYQIKTNNSPKSYISVKIAPREIPEIPKPTPMFEIFVYSPKVEGVHLRGGKVARGGLRWSDRIEDYRTEVLGLVKAQQVKNSLIVPVGAKGGFVAKQMPINASRDVKNNEGIECYKIFIQALLDITDNLEDNSIVHPKSVIFHDQSDPYLVVAADKGTATFSDIANQIALKFNFWLGDAFASGGSVGYDHKKMGITAKGAWVSVQRHFREKGINVQESIISVVGIGDMQGDVFGNGLLLSETLQLVAAFNHLDIFIDPNPDPKISFKERKRLFNLPRSSWQDYKKNLISKGGGIFSRQLKAISISEEMKKRFKIKESKLPPSELIHYILQAPVDLIWNGGIGTYIKSANESHEQVGDKSNDLLRVNGNKVRAKVIGEGGNLGVSQLGRVEFSLLGGALNTDFIDNSGGVDCSDHEVNIKILLNDIVSNGDMTIKQRNKLLENMTNEISELVLHNNYRQTQAIALADLEAQLRIDEYIGFIEQLEQAGRLDRSIEFLPSNEELLERVNNNQSLTRPELSLLISYSKSQIKEQLIKSDELEDKYFLQELKSAFPEILTKKFGTQILHHRLRLEIIATQVANHMIDMMGITHVHRVAQTTGASAFEISRAFLVSRDVFGINEYWKQIEDLDHQLDHKTQSSLMVSIIKLVRRASRWFIRIKRQDLVAETVVREYAPLVSEFISSFTEYLNKSEKSALEQDIQQKIQKKIPEDLAKVVCGQRYLLCALPIIKASEETNKSISSVAKMFFAVGEHLNLNWYSQELGKLKTSNHWQSLAKDSIRDELTWQQRTMTVALLNHQANDDEIDSLINKWSTRHKLLVKRWKSILSDIRNASKSEISIFTVANRELMDLTQATTSHY